MKLALMSIKKEGIFTFSVVYSIFNIYVLGIGFLLASKPQKLSLSLSNSYTHSGYQLENISAKL